MRRADTPPTIAPFLRWAGSKRQILPALASYWEPCFGRYIEPFAGSAALFFHLAPADAILADINADLVDTYREVRDNLSAVEATLRRMKAGPDQYYRWRKRKLSALSPAQRAARFIYLNRYCFNGLYRTNLKGAFNVPFGALKAGALPSASHLAHCSRQLRRATIYPSSFEETLDAATTGDFVYLDPPFHVNGVRMFRDYSPTSFGPEHIRRLRDKLLQLDRSNVVFLLSYALSPEARLLSRGFHARTVAVRRNIAGFAGARKRATELLISNSPPRAR
jgi:DNA adenine methylase